MADKKISQLTGASTPLAGTEVLPIVQSGSTVKVSVANLTAGRATGALSFTATSVGNDIAQLLGNGLTITHAGGTTSFATFNQFPGWGATMTVTSSATEFGINSGLPFALRDGNGLEVLKTSPQVSAVNEVTVANAATGNAPVVSATGNDTNIDLTISPKGTGSVNLAKVKIDAGTINGAMSVGGTWTAAATWTLPALTLGGTITSNGQTFSGTIANLGTVTTADINGGTIDGTTIGGSSKANGSFLTVIGSNIFTYRESDFTATNDVWYVLGAVSSNQIWRLMITDSNFMATWHRADDLYIDKSSVATFKNIYDVNPGYATREWRINAGNLEWRVTGAGGNTSNTVTAMRVA